MKRQMGVWLLIAALAVATLFYWFSPSPGQLTFSVSRFPNQTLIIDAGHGGEDGGAVSAAGTVESQINLAIAQRLDTLMGFYGVPAVMLRDSDAALYDDGCQTLREKKVSDLHNRVKLIEAVENATLISIHQNTFPSAQYHGAQVFYTNGELSLSFAQATQDALRVSLDPENDRKPAVIPESVYLMNHISCRAILVECGFLSNPQEDALLQTPEYQLKVAAALAGAYLNFQQIEGESLNGNESKNSFLLYGVRQ